MYKGLPDSHDFSKHKDFFAIYIHRYCSGHKIVNKSKRNPKTNSDPNSKSGSKSDSKDDQKQKWTYEIDFCSNIGSELFDQYRIWKVWGVDLATPRNSKSEVEEKIGVSAIKTMPKVIFVWFCTGLVVLIMTLVLGCAGACSCWVKVTALIFSVVSPTLPFPQGDVLVLTHQVLHHILSRNSIPLPISLPNTSPPHKRLPPTQPTRNPDIPPRYPRCRRSMGHYRALSPEHSPLRLVIALRSQAPCREE